MLMLFDCVTEVSPFDLAVTVAVRVVAELPVVHAFIALTLVPVGVAEVY